MLAVYQLAVSSLGNPCLSSCLSLSSLCSFDSLLTCLIFLSFPFLIASSFYPSFFFFSSSLTIYLFLCQVFFISHLFLFFSRLLRFNLLLYPIIYPLPLACLENICYNGGDN